MVRRMKLNLFKASPPDELPKKLLREFAYELSLPLVHIFNLGLRKR